MGQRAKTRQDVIFWPLDHKMPLGEFLATLQAAYDSLAEDEKATAVAECRSGTFKAYYERPMAVEDMRTWRFTGPVGLLSN
jgi:hypothetical protein